MIGESVWSEKYRPTKVSDCILPETTKKMALSIIESGQLPHFMFHGSAGTGKTTLAKAMCKELGMDVMVINGSLEGRLMDTLRTKIASFASTISLTGSRKVVIIDEADYLPSDTVQPALRGFIEEFSKTTTFILTCNFPNRIIDPIHSRCSKIDFTITADEKKKLIPQFFNRVTGILDAEGVTYDKKAVFELVLKHFPDFRRTLNELQRYASSGSIDSGILVSTADAEVNTLIGYLKNKDFTEMRRWVASTPNLELSVLSRSIYDKSYELCKPESIPQLVLDLADYDYKHAFVADKEINIVALLTTLMINIEWR